jgi:glucose-6-phosphate dehydrogenase assembly protein OpcA
MSDPSPFEAAANVDCSLEVALGAVLSVYGLPSYPKEAWWPPSACRGDLESDLADAVRAHAKNAVADSGIDRRTDAMERAEKFLKTVATNDRGFTNLGARERISEVLRVAMFLLGEEAD